MRRWIVGGAVVVAVAVVAVVLAGGRLPSGTGPGPVATPLPPVTSVDRVIAEARVVPATRAVVGATVPGAVARVAVDEGDRVAAGAVLVELDAAAARAEVAAAGAALDAAAARSEQAAATARQAKAEAARATDAWRSASAVRDQLPDSASTARERQVDAQVAAARDGIDAARAAEQAAAAAVKAAAADEARASATLDAARTAAGRLTITAPIAGTVADVRVTAGDVAAVGQPLVWIAGDGGWTFETTDLTQDEVAVIDVGGDAVVTLDGFAGASIAGRVARISAFGEDRQGDVVFTVVVVPSGAIPDRVRWNMQASVEIATTP